MSSGIDMEGFQRCNSSSFHCNIKFEMMFDTSLVNTDDQENIKT